MQTAKKLKFASLTSFQSHGASQLFQLNIKSGTGTWRRLRSAFWSLERCTACVERKLPLIRLVLLVPLAQKKTFRKTTAGRWEVVVLANSTREKEGPSWFAAKEEGGEEQEENEGRRRRGA